MFGYTRVQCFKGNEQAKKKSCGRLSTDRLQIINISASARERELTATAFPARFSTLPTLFAFSASFCHLARTVPEPNCLQGVSTAEVLCAVSWRNALALGPSRCDMQQQAKRDWCFFCLFGVLAVLPSLLLCPVCAGRNFCVFSIPLSVLKITPDLFFTSVCVCFFNVFASVEN